MSFLQLAGRNDNVVGLVSLKLRILLPLVAASLVVLFIGIYFIAHMENEHKDTVVLQEAQTMQGHFQSLLDSKTEVMAVGLQFIARNEELVRALRSGDRQRLLQLAGPINERLYRDHNITHFYFHDSQRINLLRLHKPDRYGDTIDRFTALGAERTGTLFSFTLYLGARRKNWPMPDNDCLRKARIARRCSRTSFNNYRMNI